MKLTPLRRITADEVLARMQFAANRRQTGGVGAADDEE
jgi:hypothetical protein